MIDTGASTGDVAGHSKTLNAVSIRRQRPFKAATGSDDAKVCFHAGKSGSASDDAELGSECL